MGGRAPSTVSGEPTSLERNTDIPSALPRTPALPWHRLQTPGYPGHFPSGVFLIELVFSRYIFCSFPFAALPRQKGKTHQTLFSINRTVVVISETMEYQGKLQPESLLQCQMEQLPIPLWH